MGVALLQCALFNAGLAHHIHLGAAMSGQQALEPPKIETAWTHSMAGNAGARRPPRWPGRSKNAKGLAVREASAIKPVALVE